MRADFILGLFDDIGVSMYGSSLVWLLGLRLENSSGEGELEPDLHDASKQIADSRPPFSDSGPPTTDKDQLRDLTAKHFRRTFPTLPTVLVAPFPLVSSFPSLLD